MYDTKTLTFTFHHYCPGGFCPRPGCIEYTSRERDSNLQR